MEVAHSHKSMLKLITYHALMHYAHQVSEL